MGKAVVDSGGRSRGAKRRQWPLEVKRRIVEESFGAESSVSQVARAYDVNANQVFSWRRLYQRGLVDAAGKTATLIPVRVISNDRKVSVERLDDVNEAPKSRRRRPTGIMQVEMERGRLRIEGAPDPFSLRIVLECLRG